MYLKLISCKIITREISSLVAGSKNVIDITYIKQDFHNKPAVLKDIIQAEIDRIDEDADCHTNDLKENDLKAILIGYGLCSNATVGLKSKKYPLVIPKAHDCSTFFLGSKERYKEYFENCGGSYFYSQGFLDMGATNNDEKHLAMLREEYMEKFEDEDTVEYLISMEKDMLKNYNCATYVYWDETRLEGSREIVMDIAAKKGWDFREMKGENTLLKALIEGPWDEDKFVIVPPGSEMTPSFDEEIMKLKEK
ncbi:Protein of unknown function [Acetitomaculum ruminis DSM 5522]|uniref:DUF1638 domain-containing protein n=1 Tax=Acetitomaculum ruminis DSM 5522 TaxID=1120918 RepID=A0A1I0WIY2_9FIRM|nr:DUF1638 domain-containing protein [Acetitomaculum ruminis]SFA88347.1 Protein of unknown function [Acetitomaculum ruminis DSM 5522]